MTDIAKVQYRHDEIYIAEHYGLTDQLGQLKEELLELIEAVDNYKERPCIKHVKDMNGEIADVENMTYQIKYLMHVEDAVEGIKRYKVDRQLKRIEEE